MYSGKTSGTSRYGIRIYTKQKYSRPIVVNDEDGAYQIVKHLVDNGHRKIGIITGKPDSIHTQERLLGMQRAFYENQFCIIPKVYITGTGADKVVIRYGSAVGTGVTADLLHE